MRIYLILIVRTTYLLYLPVYLPLPYTYLLSIYVFTAKKLLFIFLSSFYLILLFNFEIYLPFVLTFYILFFFGYHIGKNSEIQKDKYIYIYIYI